MVRVPLWSSGWCDQTKIFPRHLLDNLSLLPQHSNSQVPGVERRGFCFLSVQPRNNFFFFKRRSERCFSVAMARVFWVRTAVLAGPMGILRCCRRNIALGDGGRLGVTSSRPEMQPVNVVVVEGKIKRRRGKKVSAVSAYLGLSEFPVVLVENLRVIHGGHFSCDNGGTNGDTNGGPVGAGITEGPRCAGTRRLRHHQP